MQHKITTTSINDNIIVTSQFVFKTEDMLCITKNCLYLKWPEKIKIIEPVKSAGSWSTGRTENYGVHTITLSSGLYDEIIEKIADNQKQLKYKTLYEELHREVSLMPGGSEYLTAKTHFENNQQTIK